MKPEEVVHGVAGFLETAGSVEAQSLGIHDEIVGLLNRLDRAFRLLTQRIVRGAPLAAMLLLNSHSLFLCAVRIALSGQSPPTFMALRGCIESSLYALIISAEEKNAQIWLDRERDREACRRAFTAANGRRILKLADPNLEQFVGGLYEAHIDHGAHPNRLSLLGHLRFKEAPNEASVELIYLHGPDSTPVLQALAACVETGIASVCLAPHVLPEFEPAREAHALACRVYDAFQSLIQKRGLLRRFERAEEEARTKHQQG